MERTGERCQSTTSISAAEAMNANGTIVVRILVRRSWTYGCWASIAIAAEMSTTLTTLSATAASSTRETTAPAPSPWMGAINAPAAAATSARTDTL